MLPAFVIAGDEMKPHHTALLRERGVLHKDEEIEMFYTAAAFSILGNGNMLTCTRVVAYEAYGNELWINGSHRPWHSSSADSFGSFSPASGPPTNFKPVRSNARYWVKRNAARCGWHLTADCT
jgi:hypothetical protein